MTAADASALNFWSDLYLVGFALVWLGVFFEGWEVIARWRKEPPSGTTEPWYRITAEPKTSKWVHIAGDCGWVMLIIGLAMEEGSHTRITGIKDREISTLTTELKTTTKMAGEANERAGLANESAAEANERSLVLESTNLALRTKLAELETKLKPRTITPTQITNFIFLTEKITKIPITVSTGQQGFDTETFAFQLREMFSKSGFGVNSGAVEFGIERDPSRIYVRNIGFSPYGADVVLVLPSDEEFERFRIRTVAIESVNGFTRPVMNSTNEADVYSALNLVFPQIGIRAAFWKSQWILPRRFETFVPVKDQF